MSINKYFSIAGMLLFFFFVFWVFIKPIFDSKKASLAGEVISITKMKRSGDYIVELSENRRTRYINYTFLNEIFDIQIGDSLFKKPNSDLFVKSKADGITRLANDQSLLISDE